MAFLGREPQLLTLAPACADVSSIIPCSAQALFPLAAFLLLELDRLFPVSGLDHEDTFAGNALPTFFTGMSLPHQP